MKALMYQKVCGCNMHANAPKQIINIRTLSKMLRMTSSSMISGDECREEKRGSR